MSVMIKGMQLPSECSECLFSCYDISVGEPAQCIVLGEHSARYSRLKNCPLVEIPTPHGRLVDADALSAKYERFYKMFKDSHVLTDKARRDEISMFLSELKCNAATVIEAEVSE